MKHFALCYVCFYELVCFPHPFFALQGNEQVEGARAPFHEPLPSSSQIKLERTTPLHPLTLSTIITQKSFLFQTHCRTPPRRR